METGKIHLEFPCRRCKLTFNTKREHLLHRKHVHENDPERKNHVCQICHKQFANERTLEQHVKNHDISRFKSFICKECGKGFAKSEYLQRHSLIHSGEKPHSCSICGKRFNQFGNMKRHELTHVGEKPFRCKRCGKMFSQRSNLKTHIMRHQNYKPHKCNICTKRFLLIGDYEKHLMRNHNKSRAEVKETQSAATINSVIIKNEDDGISDGESFKKEDVDIELYYECGICKAIYNSFEDFQTHEIFCEIAGEVQVETENEIASSIDY